MIFGFIFFLIVLIAMAALLLFVLGLTLLVLGATIIALLFKPLKRLGMVLFTSSFFGLLAGLAFPALMVPLFDETHASLSPWTYTFWGMVGYSFTGAVFGFIYAGVEAVLLPLRYLSKEPTLISNSPVQDPVNRYLK